MKTYTVDRKSETNLYTTPHHIKQEHAHLGNTLVITITRVKTEYVWKQNGSNNIEWKVKNRLSIKLGNNIIKCENIYKVNNNRIAKNNVLHKFLANKPFAYDFYDIVTYKYV